MTDLNENMDNIMSKDEMAFGEIQDAPKKKKVTIAGNIDPTKNSKRG